MKRLFGSKRRIVAIVAVVALLVTAAVGVAAWLIASNGTASGTLGSLTAPTVIASNGPQSNPYPGGELVLTADIANPNTSPLVITAAIFDAWNSVSNPVCQTYFETNLSGVDATTGQTVPANGTLDDAVLLTVALPNDLPDQCQGSEVTANTTVSFSTP